MNKLYLAILTVLLLSFSSFTFASSEAPNNLAPVDMISSNYVNQGSFTLEFEFRNYAFSLVNAFKYQFEANGERDTFAVSDLSLGYRQTVRTEFPEEVSPGFGFVQCTVTVIEVNGDEIDGSADAYTEDLVVYDEANTSPRQPLVETFTSSTCGPCRPGNANLHSILDGLTEQPVVLKWQQNFPGAGDPYCTDETVGRRNYYEINAIPNTNVDGIYFDGNTNIITASNITGARERGALVNIQAQYELDPSNQSIRVYGTVLASVGLVDGMRLMIAVRENKTVNNIGTNGETEFFDVVKKVLPDLDGIILPELQAGESYDFDLTYSFPGDYRLPANGQPANRIDLETEHSVEDFNDLSASVWVEDRDVQFILGAANAEEATAAEDISTVEAYALSPNPVLAGKDVRLEMQLNATSAVEVALYNLSGQSVWNRNLGVRNGSIQLALPTGMLPPGHYLMHVRVEDQFFIDQLIIQ